MMDRGTSSTQLGYPSTNSSLPRPQLAMAGVLQDNRDNESRLRDLLGRITSVGDFLLGSAPSVAAEGANKGQSWGLVGELGQSADNTRQLATLIEGELTRLQAAIGC